MKSLPQLVQLQQQYGSRIHVITLNLDFDQQSNTPSAPLQNDIVNALKKQGINCHNIMSTTATHEVLNALQVPSLPAAIVYGLDGTPHQQFHGKIDFQKDVAPVIDHLLSTGHKMGE